MERSQKSHRSRQYNPSVKKKSDTDKKKRVLTDDKKRYPSIDMKKRDLTDDKKQNPKVFRMFLDFPEQDKNKCGVDLQCVIRGDDVIRARGKQASKSTMPSPKLTGKQLHSSSPTDPS
ncbi:unnamed protein product [Lactuca saligna]|uniref:Uncharacterized protein n=1 Tax=Lactuca saligna TaxID=75948 RepID=A0AA35ZAB1_LACSI|nr:unnamed protein product [Lactuca saligna]